MTAKYQPTVQIEVAGGRQTFNYVILLQHVRVRVPSVHRCIIRILSCRQSSVECGNFGPDVGDVVEAGRVCQYA